jgi:hypothetical protein
LERDTGGSLHAYEKRQPPVALLLTVGVERRISDYLHHRIGYGCGISNLYPTYQRVMVIQGKAQGNDWRAALCRGSMFERINEHHLLNCSKIRK